MQQEIKGKKTLRKKKMPFNNNYRNDNIIIYSNNSDI